HQPVHGYDVRRELLSWHANEWAHAETGSIYNALKSLAREGLVAVDETKRVGQRPERKTYRLTPEGEEALLDMARDAWWKVREPIDDLLPGVSFMPLLPRDEIIAALRSRIAQVKSTIELHGHVTKHGWSEEA